MGKTKKKRKLSAWNIFIRDNSGKKQFTLPSGSPDLKAMSRAFKKTGTSAQRSQAMGKRLSKSTTRRVSTTPKKKPTEKKTRKTAKQKSISRSVPVSKEEKKSQKAFDILEQCRLALSVPKGDWKVKGVSKGWSWSAKGFGKTIKRRKLSDLAKAVKDRTRSYI